MARSSLITALVDRVPARVADYVATNPRLKSALRPLANRALPRQEEVVTVRSGGAQGLRLLIDPQTEKYYWTGGHEPHLHSAIAANLREGQVFWDVGSHIGFFSLQAARIVGSSGEVVAFEPIPDNQRRLKRNISLNEASRITVVGEAVGDQPAELPIYSHPGGSSLMWTLDQGIGAQQHGTVPVTTLDLYLERATPPDLIKIDAEGYEVAALKGAPRLIQTRQSVFLLEFMSDTLLEEGQALLDGYEFVWLGANHWLARP